MKTTFLRTCAMSILLTHVAFSQQLPGSLDTSFGNAGIVTINLGRFQPLGGPSRCITLQDDGRIVVAAAYHRNFSNYVKAFYRFNADGSPDNTFAKNGRKIFYNGSLRSEVMSPGKVVIQGDGKILSGGDFYTGRYKTGGFIITRLLSDGSVDKPFGNKGEIIVRNETTTGYFADLDLQRSGEIVVANRDAENNFVRRFKPNGSLDSSFGTDGLFIVDGTYNFLTDIAVQRDNKILLLIDDETKGATDRDFKIVRLLRDGRIDLSFGTNGTVVIDFDNYSQDTPTSIAVLPNGRILVAGIIWTNVIEGQIGVVRLRNNGVIDPSFATNGKGMYSRTEFSGPEIDLSPNGKFYLTGEQMERVNSDGSRDLSYGTGGVTMDGQACFTAAVQKDNKLLALIWALPQLRRYTADSPIAAQNAVVNESVISKSTTFTCYPNPAKDVLHIQVKVATAITLSDQSGSVIMVKNIQDKADLNVAQLPAGVYYLKNNISGEVKKILIAK